MTTEKPPREWWINFRVGASSYAHMTPKAATQFKAFPGIEVVHVIEYSAYEKANERFDNLKAVADKVADVLFYTEKELEKKLAIATAALEYYAKGYTSFERFGDDAKPPGETARKALEEIK